MILESLIIDNIRSYIHQEIEFPKGISLFEGDIGSGKSTILMAIEFALFGLGSQRAESLLAKKEETGYAVLEFSVDGKKYEIKRTLKRKNSSVSQDPKNSWIKIDGESLPLTASELKEKVLQILKFNEPADPKAESKIFRYAVFTPQEAMKVVLSDATKRLDTIRRAFRIEDYNIAITNAQEIISKTNNRISYFKGRFSNVPELESEIEHASSIVLKTRESIAKNKAQLVTLQEEEKDKKDAIKLQQEKNDKKVRLESKSNSIAEKIDSAEQQIKILENRDIKLHTELKEIDENLRKLNKIKKPNTEKSISELTLERKQVQTDIAEKIRLDTERKTILDDLARLEDVLGEKIDSDITTLEKDLQNLQEEKKSLSESSQAISNRLEEIRDAKTREDTLKRSLKDQIAEFSSLGNACPTCKQEITDEHRCKLVEERQTRIESLTTKLKSIDDSFFESNTELKETKSKIDLCDNAISEIQKIIPRIVEYNTKSARLSQIEIEFKKNASHHLAEYGENPVEFLNSVIDEISAYDNAQAQIQTISQRMQIINADIESNKADIKSLKETINQDSVKFKEIKVQLDEFSGTDEKFDKLQQDLEKIRMQITELTGDNRALDERVSNAQKNITENKQKISESKRWKVKHKKFSEYKMWLEKFFIPTITQIERQVLLSILQDFNETYTNWFHILIDDDTKESKIDEDFTPTVTQDGYEQEIGYLSGGEKTSVALAYRLTLNSLIRKETESLKSSLLVLDEPTDGFSKNQLGKIKEVIEELRSEQVILVSHERELETYVDNIFEISKNDGVSKISHLN